jgi:xylulokinase
MLALIDETAGDTRRIPGHALAFTARRAVELLPGAGVPGAAASGADVVRPPGGGSRGPCVQQLLADVLGRPVQRVEVRSASATGAAMLAARGAGAPLAPSRTLGPVRDPQPVPELEDAYRLWLSRVPVAEA